MTPVDRPRRSIIVEGVPDPEAVRAARRAALQVRRYQRVLRLIATWERKLKRANGALKKLRGQRRYYEAALKETGHGTE